MERGGERDECEPERQPHEEEPEKAALHSFSVIATRTGATGVPAARPPALDAAKRPRLHSRAHPRGVAQLAEHRVSKPRPRESRLGPATSFMEPNPARFSPRKSLQSAPTESGPVDQGSYQAPRSGSDRGGGTRTPGLRFWRPPLYQLSYAPSLAWKGTEDALPTTSRARFHEPCSSGSAEMSS